MGDQYDSIPAALYARVSSDRQDVDLSVAASFVRSATTPRRTATPWPVNTSTRPRAGVSLTDPSSAKCWRRPPDPTLPSRRFWSGSSPASPARGSTPSPSGPCSAGVASGWSPSPSMPMTPPTGKLMEAIIEGVDEFYSEKLAQEVARGMREAASRGFWMTTYSPYGYRKVMVADGPKKRPKLEPDPATAAVVERMYRMAESGKSILDIAKTLNKEGIASSKGKLWSKTVVHSILTNETYTGTLVWGLQAKDKVTPVRVENAFPAIVSKSCFRKVGGLLRSRAPSQSHPRRVSGSYLLSGLVKCKGCGRALSGQESKSGQFFYYVCQSLMKRGSGACEAARLNAKRFEALVVNQLRECVLTENNIRDLVGLVDEEMDGVAREGRLKLEALEGELVEVKRWLDRLYRSIEVTDLDLADIAPRIREHRERQAKMEMAAEEARLQLAERRVTLEDVDIITPYAKEMSEFLKTSELTESRAFISSFVKEIVVSPGKAAIRYTIPMPDDSRIPSLDAEEMALRDGTVNSKPWWGRGDSNPHAFRHMILSHARLPIPTLPQRSGAYQWRQGVATMAGAHCPLSRRESYCDCTWGSAGRSSSSRSAR